MGKRSNFDRLPRDYYPTPAEAVRPLLPHLPAGSSFIEPCAGDGRLVDHLEAAGHHCVAALDIEPQRAGIITCDARGLCNVTADFFITNPPWARDVLHPIIENLSRQMPTWLLFDADWVHTRQSAPFMHLLKKVVSVGRVKWIPDSSFTGKDNCCWHLFDACAVGPAILIGRAA